MYVGNSSCGASTQICGILYEPDGVCSVAECAYLTQLAPGDLFEPCTLEAAVARLEHKNRWTQIIPHVDRSEHGVSLRFEMRAAWTFKQVKIRGIFWNAHQYADLYLQRPGDQFNIDSHEASLKELKLFAQRNGYYAADFFDELMYHARQKTVTVGIRIALGRKFRLHQWVVHVNGLPLEKKEQLESLLYQKMRKKIIQKTCTQGLIERHFELIDRILGAHHLKRISDKTDKKIIEPYRIGLTTTIQVEQQQIITWTPFETAIDAEIQSIVARQQQFQQQCDPHALEDLVRAYLYAIGYLHSQVHAVKKGAEIHLEIMRGERYQRQNVRVKIDDGSIDEALEQDLSINDLPNFYDKKMYSQAERALEALYRDKGFWDFQVIKHIVRPYHKKRCFDVIFVVHKGVQRIAGATKVIMSPPDIFPQKSRIPKPQKEFPFSYSTLCAQEESLLQRLHTEGYWFASLEPSIKAISMKKEQNVSRQKIDLNWLVTAGQQVQYGSMYVRGHTQLPFERIVRCMPCKKGEPWNNTHLEIARQRLEALGIFKEVHVYPLFGYDDPYVKPVVVELVDDERYELRLRGGYFMQSRHGLPHAESIVKGGGSFIIKNPANLGDTCFFDGVISRFEKRAEITYQLPLGAQNSCMGRSKGYIRNYDQPRILGGEGNAYTLDQQGFLMDFNNSYDKDCHWGVVWGMEWNRIKNVHGEIKFDPTLINKTIPQFTLEPSLLVESTDDKIATTRGWIGFTSAKVVVPFRQTPAHFRYLLELSLFYPAHTRVIAACKLRFGQIIGAPCEAILPIDRFYLGGPQSIRGYERDSVPPLGVEEVLQPNGTIKQVLSVQGGRCMASINAELRINVWKTLGLVIFQDIGSLSQSGLTQLLTIWYPATGLGFRYQTPIGAVRFDIGWKWKKQYVSEGRYAWYISLGQAF